MTEETRTRSTTGDLLHLIEQLAGFDRVGVTRLARHLGVPAPTAYRMLRALERAGYVEQLAESREYRLTLKLFELGSRVASRTTLRDLAAVEVERLAQQAGLASNVSVLVDGDVLYLAQVKTEDLLAVNLTPGSRAPATCTAMGKAMLAVEYRDVRSIVGPGPYPSRTAYSITTYEALGAELAEIQRLGYAVDRQELNLGVWCVAAPILGVRQTRPAAVSVSACRPELEPAEEERLGRLVIAAASRISDRLGGLGNMDSWLASPELAAGATATVAPEDITYAPPVLRPGKIVCVGLNYADHIAESRGVAPDRIVLFAKFPPCLAGHGDPIRCPAVTTQLDYEGELAVVIGRTASQVPVDQALDYVGGYTIINDVSARDLQGSEPQWIRGKALDTFAPLGPVLLDAAAAPAVADMRLRTLVNGDVRQDASCAQMITGVPELIAYISNGITLEPGDIIATGTPSGVALGMKPPVWLQPGDKVSIEITAIGELVNTVQA